MTKQNGLSDEMKLLKLMKDTLITTTDQFPSITHELRTVGLLLMGTKITMLPMDIPAGYICCARKMKPLSYPTNCRQFIKRFIPILRLALKAKATMVHTRDVYDNAAVEESPKDHICFGIQPTCFQSTNGSQDGLSVFSLASKKKSF